MVNNSMTNSIVYQGVRFRVESVQQPVRRDRVVMADAVVVLPLLDDDTVVMIRNERFAVGEVLWELCAGTLEEGEQPQLCAQRELIEETGYKAAHIEKLLEFYTCPGICTERMYAFLARDLQHVGQDLDENERIEVEAMPLGRAMRMIHSNEIRDAKTITTLLYYDRLARNGE